MSAKSLLYFSIATHYWFGCYYDWNYVNIPSEVHPIMGLDFLGTKKLKFLTYLDAILQAFFFTVCFLNEIIGSTEVKPKRPSAIRKFKDILLPSLAFPLSMFVGLTFWGLYFVDRELVFPKAIDPYFPTWLNHVMHTNIMIFVVMEMFISFRRYPSRGTGLSILSSFMLCYLGWIHVIHAYSGLWVYPVLDVLNLPGRVAFFAILFVLSSGLYFSGEVVNKCVWRKQLVAKEKTKAK